MDRPAVRRWLELSIWGSAVFTVAVCALGVVLTLDQYRDMHDSLLENERRATAAQRSILARQLRAQERRALEQLAAEPGDESALATANGTTSFLRDPFAIERDGTIRGPSLRRSGVPAAAFGDAAPPRVFRDAMLAAHSTAPLDQRLDALQRVEDDPLVDATWRIRARSLAATANYRAGRLADAEAIWKRLFREFETSLDSLDWPGFDALCLARAECLAAAGDAQTVARVLRDGLAWLSDRRARFLLPREELWVRVASRIATRAGVDLPELSAAATRLREERAAVRVTHDLRDLILVRARIEGDARPTSEVRRTFAGSAPERQCAIWLRVPPDTTSSTEREADLVAVGFRVDLERLQTALTHDLAQHAADPELRVLVSERPPSTGDGNAASDVVALGDLDGDLGFVHIVKSREAWERKVGKAQRPFLFAGVLIGVLGVLLVAGLLFLYRALHREMLLSRMKTEFVANVSHELKTPLALIRLCSETLALGRLRQAERRQEYYEVITRETERLSHLISNVLNFASIEAGKKSYELEERDLAGIIRQTLGSYFLQLRDKGFECHGRVPPSLPLVRADEEAIAQALINLLQNAARYSTDTKRVDAVATVRGRFVIIAVADRGIGISREDQARIWDDYYRTSESRALGTRGSGLGLSLVQHILKAHDGQVEVRSEPGKGSRFTLVLPIAPGARAHPTPNADAGMAAHVDTDADANGDADDEGEDPRHRR